MRHGAFRFGTVAVVAVATVTVSAVLVAGTVPAQPAPPAPTFVVPPAAPRTTLPPQPAPAVREPGTVRIVAACPAPQTPPRNLVPATPEFDAIVGAQSRLSATINQVQSYATTQPSTFGDLRFGGTNNGTVVVSFTGALQVHADALTKLVDIPNGVVVCPAAETAAARVALANDIVAHANGAMVSGSLTPSEGPPFVVLRADRRDVADDLVRMFGARVHVVLGEFSYPDASVPRGDRLATQPCGNVPVPSAVSTSLRWSVPKSLRIHSGGDITTKVSLKNVGRQPVSYTSGNPITGVVTRVGGPRVLARYAGAIAGVGHSATLRPGRTDTVVGLLSTASCDASLGYALAAGEYSVRFVFESFNPSVGGGTKVDQFVSNPIPLTITTDTAPPYKPSPNPPLTPVTLPGAGGGGPGATLLVVPPSTKPA